MPRKRPPAKAPTAPTQMRLSTEERTEMRHRGEVLIAILQLAVEQFDKEGGPDVFAAQVIKQLWTAHHARKSDVFYRQHFIEQVRLNAFILAGATGRVKRGWGDNADKATSAASLANKMISDSVSAPDERLGKTLPKARQELVEAIERLAEGTREGPRTVGANRAMRALLTKLGMRADARTALVVARKRLLNPSR